jgi:hypothetical protein
MIIPLEIISIIPKASTWVEKQEAFILANNIPLTEIQISTASKIGIKKWAKLDYCNWN